MSKIRQGIPSDVTRASETGQEGQDARLVLFPAPLLIMQIIHLSADDDEVLIEAIPDLELTTLLPNELDDYRAAIVVAINKLVKQIGELAKEAIYRNADPEMPFYVEQGTSENSMRFLERDAGKRVQARDEE